MPKTIDATRRARFLRALEQTGNQTLAAERAKVSRSWVRLARGNDPVFDAAVRRALELAASPTRTDQASGPAFARGGYFDGCELVRRGVRNRRVQIARARPREWSASAERRFIAVLGQTCSVFAACATVGLSPSSAYQHRRRHPGFAERWSAALAQGIVALEAALVETVCYDLGDPREPDDIPEIVFDRPLNLDHAFALFRRHSNAEEKHARAEWRARRAGRRNVS